MDHQGRMLILERTGSPGIQPAWIDIPGVVEESGRIRHRRGVTSVPGLYFLGLSWQHTRGSALLGFVKDDAAYLAEQIAAHHRAARPGVSTAAASAGAP